MTACSARTSASSTSANYVTFDIDRGIDEAKWKRAAEASDPTDPLADGELAETA